MKRFLLGIITVLIFFTGFGQTNNSIVKITFLSQPFSGRDPNNASISQEELRASTVFKKGYQYYYTLYIDPKTKRSIYKLDTLILNKPKEKANVDIMINDKLQYVVRLDNTNYLLNEEIFQRKFFAKGQTGDIEWVVTKEKKKINGYNCIKAIAKNKDLMTTVWFTQEVAVSNGPVNYFGLPGLVVWAEDFFWTINLVQVKNIKDNTNGFSFNKEFEKYTDHFEKKQGKDVIKESQLLIKKTELVKSMIRQSNSQ